MNKAKDITQKILISLSALLVAVSCTLDMEDWVPTEEEKGYGEIASMEYDGMKFEYEFKEETIHLTDNLLEYLAYTDGDTILYFMDNMPEEYRPRTGGYVAAFCCDALPLGLNAKVTSVEHSNGMYVVETKPVELAETYKEFKLDIEVVDILRDKSQLVFKKDSEAQVVRKGKKLKIEKFYPMNLLKKLSLQKSKAGDWKELVESVMIDFNYDGVLEPSVIDLADENADGFVKGEYDIPDGAGTIRVKITDLLSESLEVEVK